MKVRSRLEQQVRTADRIGRLFLQSPPVKKRAPTASSGGDCVKREKQAYSSVESSLAPRRGKGGLNEEGLRNKSLELSTSRWASRPHIVMTPAHTHKDLVDVGKCSRTIA